jgi:eukaryotic translation initiation factor 2-alpha kinase 4
MPNPPAEAVRMLDATGGQLMLRHDLRLPLCSWLASSTPMSSRASAPLVPDSRGHASQQGLRRYEIASMYRQPRSSGPYALHMQADIDIVSPGTPDSRGAGQELDYVIADSEVICMTQAIIARLPEAPGSTMHIRLSHTTLLATVLCHIGADAEHAPVFLKEMNYFILSNSAGPARERAWPALCRTLRAHGLPKSVFGRCKPLALQGPENAASAVEWLASALTRPAAHSVTLQRAFDELRLLLCHLGTWGLPVDGPPHTSTASSSAGVASDVTTVITMDPFMLPPTSYHKGLSFQVFWRLPASVTGTERFEDRSLPSLVAHGGRYDALLKELWPTHVSSTSSPPMHGAGVTMNVDRLVDLSSLLRAARSGSAAHLQMLSASAVLVAARGGGGMLRERLSVLQLLWSADIAAETMHRNTASGQEQFEFLRQRGIRVLVLLQFEQFERNRSVMVCLQGLLHRKLPLLFFLCCCAQAA